jgi:hypothetical protein
MKSNLPFHFAIAFFLWLPSLSAQVLTEIKDSSSVAIGENRLSKFYLLAGQNLRFELGYQQMLAFFDSQDLDNINAFNISHMLGGGLHLGDRFTLELTGELNVESDEKLLSDSRSLSATTSYFSLHALLGYQLWQGKRKSISFQTGCSLLAGRVSFREDRPGNFDFENIDADDRPMVRSWPNLSHTQGALHFVLQYKYLAYDRWRGVGDYVSINMGFVSGLWSKSWSVDSGTGFNLPTDRGQYLYLGCTYNFHFRSWN